ncbi:MAG TPA: diaminobutyrate acetyltransferase [Acidimicrobiales bacterium]
MPPLSTNRPAPQQGGSVRFRTPEPSDGRAMWALAKRSGLDLNSPYAYVMWGDYHAATSVVATLDDAVVGYITGFRVPDAPGRVFVWQIAVDEHQRGHGIGGRMLDDLVRRTGAEAIEATVTPENAPSAALFRALGARHGTTVEETPAYEEHLFPEGHEAEVRFRIPVVANEITRD